MDSTHPRPALLAAFQTQDAAQKRKRKAKRHKPSHGTDFSPLIAKGGLFFRVLSPADSTTSAGRVLQRTIEKVWDHIPATDQQCMQDYWHGESWSESAGYCEVQPPHKPLIQLTDTGSSTCERFGLVLSFPVALIEEPERLAAEIANVLACVFRYASRDFWHLYMETVERPMEAWEKSRKKPISSSARRKKEAALEQEYRRKHDAAVNEVLCRWGW